MLFLYKLTKQKQGNSSPLHGMWNKDRAPPPVLSLKIMGLDGLAEVKRLSLGKELLHPAAKTDALVTDGRLIGLVELLAVGVARAFLEAISAGFLGNARRSPTN